jgi:UTP--glucose-1-phosphate uridylyltransferase
MTRTRIRKAVIPAAGLGTRFLPATKAIPKEMIPIVDVPMIQHIVEEAVRSGIQEVVLITHRHKEAIENHFDYNAELEDHLEEKQKADLAEVSRSIGRLCQIISIRQKMPLGLGHAVLCAAPVIGDEPFAVLLGDDLMDSSPPCIQQLMEVAQTHQASVIGVMEVPLSEVSKYGIMAGVSVSDGIFAVQHLIEKPAPEQAPSRMAIAGRYVLSPDIFRALAQTPPGKGGEIQLTDALVRLIGGDSFSWGSNSRTRPALLGYALQGVRYDTGDRLGMIDATLAYALKRPELAAGVRVLLHKYWTQEGEGRNHKPVLPPERSL